MKEIAVRVTDLNEWAGGPIRDGFDGVLYTFERDQPVTIPLAAAKHIFGCDDTGKPDPSYIQRRWGWNTPDTVKEYAKWLANIRIEPVTLETVELSIDHDEPEGSLHERALKKLRKFGRHEPAAIDVQ